MSISKVGTYAFYNHPNLERAVVSAPVIEACAFQNAKKLEVVDLTSSTADTINAYVFSGCSKLTHLIIRSTARSSLSGTSALNGTKIKNGDGGVYVPANLLDSYKSATNWSTFADNIFPIGEYPKSNFDSISDSWSTILSNASYATDYAVKDTKTLELTDGTKIKMDLAALDTDVKSDNSGTAKMTWICHGIPFTHRMNASNTNSGGYDESEMASYLVSDILSKFPTEVRSHVVSVKKYHRSKSPTDEILTSNLEIFLLSHHEVFGTTYYEDSGPVYSTLFPNKSSRVKYNTSNSESNWWLRSSDMTTSFRYVSLDGNESGTGASVEYGVVFGFCTD